MISNGRIEQLSSIQSGAVRGQLPENVQAFFVGIVKAGMGQLTVSQVGRIKFATESSQSHHHSIMEAAFGFYGEVGKYGKGLRVYLGEEQFGFLLNPPPVNARYLRSEARFAPFTLAFLVTRTGPHGFLNHPDSNIVGTMFKNYQQRYSETIGRLQNRTYSGQPGFTLRIKDQPRVLGNLVASRHVRSLPFFWRLAAGEVATPPPVNNYRETVEDDNETNGFDYDEIRLLAERARRNLYDDSIWANS